MSLRFQASNPASRVLNDSVVIAQAESASKIRFAPGISAGEGAA